MVLSVSFSKAGSVFFLYADAYDAVAAFPDAFSHEEWKTSVSGDYGYLVHRALIGLNRFFLVSFWRGLHTPRLELCMNWIISPTSGPGRWPRAVRGLLPSGARKGKARGTPI